MSRLVLIAIDGSEQAEAAFLFYLDNLHQSGNQLLLIHSAEPPTMPSQQLETTKLMYGGDSSVRGDGGGRGCEVRADATHTIPEHKADAMYMSAELWAEMLESEKVKVKKLEECYAQKMKEHHVSGRIKAIFGNKPGETIIAEAKENHASMIVMGSRGMGTLRRTILGSVSDFVLHHAHCPVTVCRH